MYCSQSDFRRGKTRKSRSLTLFRPAEDMKYIIASRKFE
ncbi:unnamed protein product [Phyllotreta striolata]|uniref:Uncharacterized protein n=1 Tax=Phyllotreta striolata TaxID=444603 RepID=A0A9N9U1R2_PHYSR|nr:unnamed protein product [Phyllotreta striolata]